MKVEHASKSNHETSSRKDSAHEKRVENTSRFAADKSKFADSATSAAQQNTGAFAKILEETRKQAAKENDFTKAADRAADSNSDGSTETDNDTKNSRAVLSQDEIEERNENKNDGDNQSDNSGDNSSGFGGLMFQTEINRMNEGAIPAAARSILHVADLERIVSAIRAQNLQNARQIVISLKHSVLEGLQIKLTAEENGKLKAEFLAASEQIKNQLTARREELANIFRERGINLAEMSIKQDSGSPNQFAEGGDSFNQKIESADSIVEENNSSETGSETSYRI